MKKNDLIKLLQDLPGNPDVVLWNGLVEDYMHINPVLVKGDLVKQTLTDYLEKCRLEECVDRQDWEFQFSPQEREELVRMYKRVCKWECNQYVTLDDIKEKRYRAKRVVYINAKLRGETMHDRLGAVSY